MKYVTDINDLDLNKTYTYADYITWQFKERVELLWGKIKKMTAAPSTRHQKVVGELYVAIRNTLGRGDCQVFVAPFDVRLMVKEHRDYKSENVVQPDICVVCDESKIDERGCTGAPDLIVEVLSPATSTRDLKDKLKLYEQAGVPEYWVVDPHDGIVHMFVADKNNKYQGRYPVTAEDELRSETIPSLIIQMEDIFPDILKEPEEPYGPNIKRW